MQRAEEEVSHLSHVTNLLSEKNKKKEMSNYILIINILRVIFLFPRPSNPRNVTCDHCDFFSVNESYT